jgi:hypothetical protein
MGHFDDLLSCRDAAPQTSERDASIHRAGVKEGELEVKADEARDGALPRSRRAVDGDD